VLVPGCHGGMFDHNTMRVLTSFRIVFLTFKSCFRQVTSDSSKGATVMIVRTIAYIIKMILFLLAVLLTLLQVTSNNLEEAIVKIAEGNVLKERP
jgi:hypothetical protein